MTENESVSLSKEDLVKISKAIRYHRCTRHVKGDNTGDFMIKFCAKDAETLYNAMVLADSLFPDKKIKNYELYGPWKNHFWGGRISEPKYEMLRFFPLKLCELNLLYDALGFKGKNVCDKI